jgi:hypothetical protein
MKSKIILPLVLTSVAPSAFASITFTNDIVYDEYIKNNNNIKFIVEKTNESNDTQLMQMQEQMRSSNMFVETKDYNVTVYYDNTNKQQKNKDLKDTTKRKTKISKNKEQVAIDKENNVVLVTEQFKQQTGIKTHNNWKTIKGFGNTKLITNKILSVNNFTKLTEIAPNKYSNNLIKQPNNNQKFQKNRYVSANRKIKQ